MLDLIPPGALNDRTRLVLANAIYFKAPWKAPFAERNTKPRPFEVKGGQAVTVTTMEERLELGYQRSPGFEAITLPYVGGDLQFLVLLPSRGQRFADVEKGLTADKLARLAHAPVVDVHLYLPKFRIEPSGWELSSLLKELGMTTAFTEKADFSRMAASRLMLSAVFHKTFMTADEKGTEAAAATAAVVSDIVRGGDGPPPPPIEVHVDRPFFFAIQHRPSGACIFLGRVTDPR
jgi:serpin B